MKNSSLLGPITAMLLPLLYFEILKSGLLSNHTYELPHEHFYIVSAVSLLALGIAILIGFVGSKLRNIKIIFLSLAFISLAQMFSVHGLSTPNFILGVTHLPSVSAQLSMILATIWLWLSSFPSDHKWIKYLSDNSRFLFPAWIGSLSVFAVISMNYPQLVDFIPITVRPLNWLVMATTILLNVITMLRYYQSYRYTRFPLQYAIVYSVGWLIISQIIIVTGELWRMSWWIYHFLLLASMMVMLAGLLRQYAEKGNLVKGLKALFTNDPFERITASISPTVKKLVIATEQKDTYTAGHTFRVTMYALKLAEELRLRPELLRAIAQGTLLHDVGKIQIPDSILNKPGRLTTEERDIIEKHPMYGYEMCRDLGFMKEEMSIIRYHHEKWDGTGYPDRLIGVSIPFEARIVAVADVYDALTSDRAYRKAWTHEEAMRFIIEQKGIHFDPDCVDAWCSLCDRDPSVYQYPSQMIKNSNTQMFISTIC
jgi:putative nucleotidyltransferase with HDIG domain